MRILLTTHGTAHDQVALRFGAEIACCADESAAVLTVIEQESARPQAEAILAHARELLAAAPGLRSVIRIGPAAREIIREAEEGRYDLIVVGERQNPNLLTRFLSGSTSIRVVEHAPCPVVVAKGRAGPIRRLLLCDSGAQSVLAGLPVMTSGAGQPEAALIARFTAQLAGMLHGEEQITVLHVMSQISAGPGVKDNQLRADAEELISDHTPEGELLQQDVNQLQQPGVQVIARVRHGLVVDEILEEARTGDYDLVVIGAHRGEGWQRILLDDLAHKILVQMDRPVLVVR